MAINADTLLERLYLKSQITRWRIIAIVAIALALIFAVEQYSPNSPIERDYVARMSFEGIIFDDQKVYNLIEEVSNNPKIKAVVVWLDTPGGSAVGGEEIYVRLRKMAARKPVVSVMRSVGASAGYMVALGTDYIIAREGTITGSIGVIIQTAEITDLAQKLGIKPITVKSGPLKGSPSPLEKTTPESERMMQAVIDDFYNRFIDMVTERRKLPRDRVVTLADGRVYSGKGALENRLIDALGGEEEAIKWLQKERNIRKGLEIRDVQIEQEESLFDQLTQSISGKFFQRSSLSLDGLAAIWHPQLH